MKASNKFVVEPVATVVVEMTVDEARSLVRALAQVPAVTAVSGANPLAQLLSGVEAQLRFLDADIKRVKEAAAARAMEE